MAQSGIPSDFIVRKGGLLLFRNRICVPTVESLKEMILQEAHGLADAMHPDSTKIYQKLRQTYWCCGMKWDKAGFVARCLVC